MSAKPGAAQDTNGLPRIATEASHAAATRDELGEARPCRVAGDAGNRPSEPEEPAAAASLFEIAKDRVRQRRIREPGEDGPHLISPAAARDRPTD